MATRALAAAAAAVAGRRAARQGGLAVFSSGSCCRGGGASQSFSHSTADREAAQADADADATAAQVEAALNRKNVDVVEGDRSATLVASDVAEALGGVGDGDDVAGADDAWVPDQETGVFVPADEASGDGTGTGNGHTAAVSAPPSSSVLDQAVFVREEDMEDVERPEIATVVTWPTPAAAPSDERGDHVAGWLCRVLGPAVAVTVTGRHQSSCRL